MFYSNVQYSGYCKKPPLFFTYNQYI